MNNDKRYFFLSLHSPPFAPRRPTEGFLHGGTRERVACVRHNATRTITTTLSPRVHVRACAVSVCMIRTGEINFRIASRSLCFYSFAPMGFDPINLRALRVLSCVTNTNCALIFNNSSSISQKHTFCGPPSHTLSVRMPDRYELCPLAAAMTHNFSLKCNNTGYCRNAHMRYFIKYLSCFFCLHNINILLCREKLLWPFIITLEYYFPAAKETYF